MFTTLCTSSWRLVGRAPGRPSVRARAVAALVLRACETVGFFLTVGLVVRFWRALGCTAGFPLAVVSVLLFVVWTPAGTVCPFGFGVVTVSFVPAFDVAGSPVLAPCGATTGLVLVCP